MLKQTVFLKNQKELMLEKTISQATEYGNKHGIINVLYQPQEVIIANRNNASGKTCV